MTVLKQVLCLCFGFASFLALLTDHINIRIQFLKLYPGIRCLKPPVYRGRILIVRIVPFFQFITERFDIRDPPVKAFTGHDIDPNFSDIKPAPVFRGVMDFELFGDPSGLFWRKRLIQRRNRMCIKITRTRSGTIGNHQIQSRFFLLFLYRESDAFLNNCITFLPIDKQDTMQASGNVPFYDSTTKAPLFISTKLYFLCIFFIIRYIYEPIRSMHQAFFLANPHSPIQFDQFLVFILPMRKRAISDSQIHYHIFLRSSFFFQQIQNTQ